MSQCSEPVYQSGDNRVLFQDEVWKIGTLKNDLDCNTLPSIVQEEYRTKEKQIPRDNWWIDIKIFIKGFNRRVEAPGLKLVGGTNVDAKSKTDCFKKDWVDFSHDKDIVVAFQNSNCLYDFVDEAELEVETWRTTLFVHPAGKI